MVGRFWEVHGECTSQLDEDGEVVGVQSGEGDHSESIAMWGVEIVRSGDEGLP